MPVPEWNLMDEGTDNSVCATFTGRSHFRALTKELPRYPEAKPQASKQLQPCSSEAEGSAPRLSRVATNVRQGFWLPATNN